MQRSWMWTVALGTTLIASVRFIWFTPLPGYLLLNRRAAEEPRLRTPLRLPKCLTLVAAEVAAEDLVPSGVEVRTGPLGAVVGSCEEVEGRPLVEGFTVPSVAALSCTEEQHCLALAEDHTLLFRAEQDGVSSLPDFIQALALSLPLRRIGRSAECTECRDLLLGRESSRVRVRTIRATIIVTGGTATFTAAGGTLIRGGPTAGDITTATPALTALAGAHTGGAGTREGTTPVYAITAATDRTNLGTVKLARASLAARAFQAGDQTS